MADQEIELTKTAYGYYDIFFDEDGDIASKDFFDTAILMSVYCEQRAEPSEMRDPMTRRGWIGNVGQGGFQIGSKVWLFSQSRLNRTTLNNIVSAVRNCLDWLIADGYATDVRVFGDLTSSGVSIDAIIERPSGRVEFRFSDFWNNTGS